MERGDQVFETKKAETICCFCECALGVHICFLSCPLLQGEKICAECCQQDILSVEGCKKLAQVTGEVTTQDQIETICKACGYNSGVPQFSPEKP